MATRTVVGYMLGLPAMEALEGREVDAGMKIIGDVTIGVSTVVKEVDDMKEVLAEDDPTVVVIFEWDSRVPVRWLWVRLGVVNVPAGVVVLEYSTEVEADEPGKPVE